MKVDAEAMPAKKLLDKVKRLPERNLAAVRAGVGLCM